MVETKKAFNPASHLLNVGTAKKPRMYLEVKHRLHWFRQECPEGTIETEIVHLDLDREVSAEVSEWDETLGKSIKITKHAKGIVIFKATVTDGRGGKATGTKMENAAAFGDFLEKAETGAIGRALAGLGYGTQFTGDELDEGARIVDSPIERPAARRQKAEDQAPDPSVKAATKPLYSAAKQAKERATRLGVIIDDQGWLALLSSLGIAEVKSGKDIAAINARIAELEKSRLREAS